MGKRFFGNTPCGTYAGTLPTLGTAWGKATTHIPANSLVGITGGLSDQYFTFTGRSADAHYTAKASSIELNGHHYQIVIEETHISIVRLDFESRTAITVADYYDNVKASGFFTTAIYNNKLYIATNDMRIGSVSSPNMYCFNGDTDITPVPLPQTMLDAESMSICQNDGTMYLCITTATAPYLSLYSFDGNSPAFIASAANGALTQPCYGKMFIQSIPNEGAEYSFVVGNFIYLMTFNSSENPHIFYFNSVSGTIETLTYEMPQDVSGVGDAEIIFLPDVDPVNGVGLMNVYAIIILTDGALVKTYYMMLIMSSGCEVVEHSVVTLDTTNAHEQIFCRNITHVVNHNKTVILFNGECGASKGVLAVVNTYGIGVNGFVPLSFKVVSPEKFYTTIYVGQQYGSYGWFCCLESSLFIRNGFLYLIAKTSSSGGYLFIVDINNTETIGGNIVIGQSLPGAYSVGICKEEAEAGDIAKITVYYTT